MKSHGFTLVELIVVVTILAILGTIGFISYNGYLVGVRDSNRLSQLQQLASGIELYRAKNQLFLPDSSVPVKAGGNVIAYQGFLGQSQLDLLDYSKGGKDPKDGEYFTYYVTSDRKLYQLLGFLEDSTNQASAFINKTYAADYSNRFATTTGKKLGVLTDAGTNLPIQYLSLPSGIDLLTTTGSYTAYYSDKTNLTGTGQTLIGTLPNGSCKRIKETGLANLGSGVYSINPTGTGAFNVYCDMDTDGGGWTLIMQSTNGGSCTDFGVFQDCGYLMNFTSPYSIKISRLASSQEVLTYRTSGTSYAPLGWIQKQYLTHSTYSSGMTAPTNNNITFLSIDNCSNKSIGLSVNQNWTIGMSSIYYTISGINTGGGWRGWDWGWNSCGPSCPAGAGIMPNGVSVYGANDGCYKYNSGSQNGWYMPNGVQAAVLIR